MNEENLSLSEEVNKDAQTVTLTVNGSNGDFLKNLTSVKLGEDTVYAKGVESSDAVYYVVWARTTRAISLCITSSRAAYQRHACRQSITRMY